VLYVVKSFTNMKSLKYLCQHLLLLDHFSHSTKRDKFFVKNTISIDYKKYTAHQLKDEALCSEE
jgi:hypothetical protein